MRSPSGSPGAGADVVLSYAGHRADTEAVAQRVTALGRSADVLHADLGEPGAARALVERARASAPVDVLVANAGTGVQAGWDEVTDELWERTFAVNVTATWQLTRAALPAMLDRRFGRVLYVSSVAALNGGVIGPHYAASKAALHGLMHHLAPRVAGRGVTVNTIAPALVAGTRMLPDNPDDPGALPMPIPVGHLGEPQDIAAMAVAILVNRYVTDKVITVDGGLYPS